ncbi:F-box protein At1g47056-like isoform X2 [Contarinia nasturtii]|uniref:F-box protein At1g47056-like isoform X2 n=1 Tax=Contarinia nasturtii TaxID=265458 RepID=UPI0012D38CD3|nr:F-box protein At1g47056-like isoform X2 [Contarinia nasturtii]
MSNSDEPSAKRYLMDTDLSTTTQPINETTTILKLNDDCLYAIFGYLNIESLCHTANVCKRFRPVTEQVFHRYHSSVKFKSATNKESSFRRILCKFGHLITSLDVSFAGRYSDFGTDAIAEYCSTDLERLILHRVIISSDDIALLIPRLKHLEIRDCVYNMDMDNSADWYKVFTFKNCPKLEVFAFNMENEGCEFLVQKFPKLKELMLNCEYVRSDIFADIMGLNSQLKMLNIQTRLNDELIYSIIHAKDLENLTISGGNKSNWDYKAIRTVNGYARSFIQLIESLSNKNIPIEHLSIDSISIKSQEIHSLRTLTTLRSICLSGVTQMNEVGVAIVLDKLPLLESLTFRFGLYPSITLTGTGLTKMVESGMRLKNLSFIGDCNIKLTLEQYKSLLKVIQNSYREKISIRITGNKRLHIKVPARILIANENTLEFIFDQLFTDDSDN